MNYKLQVDKSHYFKKSYLTHDRWINYWRQIETIIYLKSDNILEIDVGNKIVSLVLKNLGFFVTTLDIDSELCPDVVGSVIKMPFNDNSYEVVLAAEILEHLPWNDLPTALKEILRVSKKYVIIVLPHSGFTFACTWKTPLLGWHRLIFKIPHFWEKHIFNGEHYWELGKKNHSVNRIKQIFKETGFDILLTSQDPSDPSHYLFILRKNNQL